MTEGKRVLVKVKFRLEVFKEGDDPLDFDTYPESKIIRFTIPSGAFQFGMFVSNPYLEEVKVSYEARKRFRYFLEKTTERHWRRIVAAVAEKLQIEFPEYKNVEIAEDE